MMKKDDQGSDKSRAEQFYKDPKAQKKKRAFHEQYASVLEEIAKTPAFGILKYVAQGGILAEPLEISPQELEHAYFLAFQLYRNNRYDDASTVFAYLTLLNPYDVRFFTGLGHCHTMLQLYPKAYECYSYACMYAANDPIPHFHAAETALKLGTPHAREWAFDLYQKTISFCTAEEYQEVLQLSKAKLELLKKKTQQES